MRQANEILQDVFMDDTGDTVAMRLKFEEAQEGIVGDACFDRIYNRDGAWKYVDPSMNARWQGFQLAHMPQ